MAKIEGAGDILTSVGQVRDKQPIEVLGPCLVSIGSPLVTRIKFEASKTKMSNYNTKLVLYWMHLFNGKKEIGLFGICEHARPYMFSPAIEHRDFAERQYRELGYRDVFTYEIYDGAGAVTIGRKWSRFGSTCGNIYLGSMPKERAGFMYKINDFLRSEGDFYLSQEEAVKLWNSIHIDLKDKPTPKQDATPDGNDLVQKLKQLKEALDAGLITEKEYQEKRQATLSKM